MADLVVPGGGWFSDAVRAAAPIAGLRLRTSEPTATTLLAAGAEASPDTATALDRLRRGLPTLLAPPMASSPAAADALVAAAEEGGGLAGYAEPLVHSPLVDQAVAHRRGIGDAHLLGIDLAGSASGSEVDPFTDLAPAALSLLLALLPPAEAASVRTDESGGVVKLGLQATDGLRVAVELSGRAGPANWSAQIASDHGVVRVELAPGRSVESQGLDVTPPDEADTDPILLALGFPGMLRGFAGVAAGRGGRVCPLGFGRAVVELLAAVAQARGSGTEVALPFAGPRDQPISGR